MYNAPANGPAKGFNKTLCNPLKKVVSKSRKDWLKNYRKSFGRTICNIGCQHSTPYALVYGVEVVLPLEIQISSLPTARQEGF